MTYVWASAAVPVGSVLWMASSRQARSIGSRSGALKWWVGAAIGIAAVVLAFTLPLTIAPLLALPLLLCLGIAVVTDFMEHCVYDSISIPLIVCALFVAAMRAAFLPSLGAAVVFGLLGLTWMLFADAESGIGLADVYGLAFLGALFGWAGWLEVVAAFLATAVLIAAQLASKVVMKRALVVEMVPYFPGIAVAAVLGLTPVVGKFEAFCASLV